MPIPESILNVPRPTNTVVYVYGKDRNLYGVRQRVGCKNVDGRHIPINGPTIGHIIEGKYVPIDTNSNKSVSTSQVDLKNWADIIHCDKLFKNIQDELLAVYNQQDTMKIYCISILRVCFHGIKDYELQEAYETSFLSELYPGVALSKNTVSKFLNDLGKTVSRITQFMQNRAAQVSIDHHLLIDGTLKSDESKVNTLSDFSRKAKTKGTRDISVLFAFDLEEMEPVCSKCFPGNMLDCNSYEAFIAENGITKGLVVADKGFPSSAAHEQFESNPDLHYLNPIKRNSKLIGRHKMMEFTGVLPGYEGVLYKKEKCKGTNKWLYSYRDNRSASIEEHDWIERSRSQSYTYEKFKKKRERFGTVVLECDMDLSPEVVYKAYDSRWEIEIVMRYYKSACEFDETRVHDDYSVIGSEFCDFLSVLLTFRLIKSFDKVELLKKYTYHSVLVF